MNLSEPKSVLRELERHAKKRFGQHFLSRRDVVERMVRASGVSAGDRVVEIGPGLGILTEALLKAGADVTVVEVDNDLQDHIRRTFPGVRVVHADATKVNWAEICPGSGWRVVANLPYNVGTGLVMDIARRPDIFESLVVMLQAEVVARFVAVPGTKAYGALTVQLGVRAASRALFGVPPSSFVPPPKVASTVVKVDIRPEPEVGAVTPKAFDRVVKSAFSQRRKTLRNSLGSLYGKERAEQSLTAVGIEPSTRAEALDVEQFRALAGALEG